MIPKWVCQRVQSGASSFNFQYRVVSLRLSISCLRLLPCVPIPSIFSSVTSFRRQFLRKMWPIQLVFLCFIVYSLFFPPRLCVILLHFSRGQSNWSSPSCCSTTFQKFQGVSDLLSEVLARHHIVFTIYRVTFWFTHVIVVTETVVLSKVRCKSHVKG
jgi:hypothetical protein